MLPLNVDSRQRFGILRRRIMQAVLCSNVDRSIILVFESRAFLGLLADQFKHLNVIAACEGEREALSTLSKNPAGLLVAGDKLAEGQLNSMGEQAIRLQPDLRMMAIIQDPASSLGCHSFHAVIADADIGADDYPVYQGLMAMLANITYDSPTIQATRAALDCETIRSRRPRVELTPREHDILRCYAMGLTNREAATMLGLSIYTVQTYSADLLSKLGVNNRQKALLKALAMGISQITIQNQKAR